MNNKAKNMIENMENGHKKLVEQARKTTWLDRLNNINLPSKKVLFTALGAVSLIGAGVAYQLLHDREKA